MQEKFVLSPRVLLWSLIPLFMAIALGVGCKNLYEYLEKDSNYQSMVIPQMKALSGDLDVATDKINAYWVKNRGFPDNLSSFMLSKTETYEVQYDKASGIIKVVFASKLDNDLNREWVVFTPNIAGLSGGEQHLEWSCKKSDKTQRIFNDIKQEFTKFQAPCLDEDKAKVFGS